MSGGFVSPLGELQGNLKPPTTSTRPCGKVPNFATGYPSPDLAMLLVSRYWAQAYVYSRLAGYNRLVAEIGPWMLARRKERATT